MIVTEHTGDASEGPQLDLTLALFFFGRMQWVVEVEEKNYSWLSISFS